MQLLFQWTGRQPYQDDGSYDCALLSAMDALTIVGNALNLSFVVFSPDAGHHMPTEDRRYGFGCR